MRIYRSIGLIVALIVISSCVALAAVPQTMNVQGRLTDNNGNPVAGAATLTFKIFTTPIDPREIWPQQGANDESHAVVLGADGLWTVEIGTVYPITSGVYSDSSRWLEVKHQESGTVFPRIHMSSGAYSYRVSTVDDATGGDIFGDVFLHSTFYVGALGDAGHVVVRDATTFPRVKLNGELGEVQAIGGLDLVKQIDGDMLAGLGTNGATGGGVLRTRDVAGNQTMIAGGAANGVGGFINVHLDNSIWAGVTIDGDDGNSGRITVVRPDGGGIDNNVVIDADAGDGGANVSLYENGSETIRMDASGGGGGAGMLMWNSLGNQTVEIDADEEEDNPAFRLRDQLGATKIRLQTRGPASGGGGEIYMWNNAGFATVEIDADENDDGAFRLFAADGTERIEAVADEASDGGQILLRNAAGTATIVLDAAQGASGRITTQLLQITGGADLSEQFDISPHAGGTEPLPGMVVCLDANNPGKLIVSGGAYDRTVAGIISGAGGVHPGMLMGQDQSEANGRYPVALTGRVYVMADATSGPIQVGDLLTTADVTGHAMKVSDYDRAHGAIIGKAMSTLDSGRGLVLALVTLH